MLTKWIGNKFNRNDLAYLIISLLLAGFLFNRVIHSIGIFFACIFIVSSRYWIRIIFQDKFLISFLAIPVLVFIGDLVHAPAEIYKSTFIPKMALLVYPLFLKIWSPNKKQINEIFHVLMIVSCINMIYSVTMFLENPSQILDSYKVAKVMPTLALGDHIRISWMTVLALWGVVYTLRQENKSWVKNLSFMFIFISILYLHFIAVKTGLFLLYSSFFIFIIYSIILKNYQKSILILLFISLSPILAYKWLPSLQNRVAYIQWDVKEYLSGNRQIGLSDGSRLASIKAGWAIAEENMLLGVGRSTLKDKTNKWYATNEPSMPAIDYIIPSSQIIILIASCGILGLILFLYHVSFPLLGYDVWKNSIFICVYLPSIATFIYETHFEGQFAIFVYAFFMYLFYLTTLVDKKDT